jgi:hypothetical protein
VNHSELRLGNGRSPTPSKKRRQPRYADLAYGRAWDWVKIRTPAGMDIQAERAKWNE